MLKKFILSVLVLSILLTAVFASAAELTEDDGTTTEYTETETEPETEEESTTDPGETEEPDEPTDPCAASHDLIYVGEKKATCEEPGVIISHYICKRCGKRFFDLAASLPVTDESLVISQPTGHDWGEWEKVKPATMTEPGLMRRFCKNTPDLTKKLKVTIDPGHSYYDNRGIIQEYYEGRRMFTLMTYLVAELEKYVNIEIVTTRHEITDAPELESRGQLAADNGSELFISLHSNWYASSAATGVSVYRSYFRPESAELGTLLGLAITDVINEATGVTYMRNDGNPMIRIEPATEPENGDGVTQDYYNVIRNSVKSEACKYSYIIEHGFHSNYDECKFLLDDNNLKKIAAAEANVIAEYFSLYTEKDAPVGDRHVEYMQTPPTGSPILPVKYELDDGFTADAKNAVAGGTTVYFHHLSEQEFDDLKAGLDEMNVLSAYELCCKIGDFQMEQNGDVYFTYALPEGADAENLHLYSYEDGEFEHIVLSYDAEDNTAVFKLDRAGVYVFCIEEIEYVQYDVNGDGAVNNKDVVALFKYLSGDELAAASASVTDTNEDGASNNKDVVFLFQYLSQSLPEEIEYG